MAPGLMFVKYCARRRWLQLGKLPFGGRAEGGYDQRGVERRGLCCSHGLICRKGDPKEHSGVWVGVELCCQGCAGSTGTAGDRCVHPEPSAGAGTLDHGESSL